MHGQRAPYRPGGCQGQPPPQPSPLQQPLPLNVNTNFPMQGPNVYLQNLGNTWFQSLPVQQNFNSSCPVHQNPNFPIQSPSFLAPQQFPNTSAPQQPPQSLPPQESKQIKKASKLKRIDRAAEKAWRNFIATGESVSAWKVSQAAVVALQADSWGSFGFRMQEVPSLHRLIVTEGKINAFIHCFVGVWRITTLYDLEEAICKNEGIGQFEELGLGPLLRHPLVLHYFSLSSNATEVCKITSEEIILYLHDFMDTCKKKDINVDEFLDFIAKRRLVLGKEMLGVRIQCLGTHISFIQEAKGSEVMTLKKCQQAFRKKSCDKAKRSLFPSQKKDLEERYSAICKSIESFSSTHEVFCGKHIRFVSSSSEDEESDDGTDEEKKTGNDLSSNLRLSSENVNISNRASSCPYPSATEEMSRLGLKGGTASQSSPAGDNLRHKGNKGSFRKKRKKFEDVISTLSVPSKLLKGDTGEHNVHPIGNGSTTEEVSTIREAGVSLSNSSMRMFVTTWKDACKEHTVAEVLERMLQFYKQADCKTAAGDREKTKMFCSYPFIGLLNIAVKSIKDGMWDSIYDTFQSMTQDEFTDTVSAKFSEYENIDVETGENHTPVVSERSMQICSVTVEEIIDKVTRYFEPHEFQKKSKSLVKNKFIVLKKLCNCELWLVDQFGVKEFKFLGYGEFFNFLEKHASLLPAELQLLLASDICEKSSMEVCMLQHQLIVLVSQASNSLWENETITEQMISALLASQFPLLSFKILENGSIEYFLQTVEKYKDNAISKCVLFSATLGVHHTGDSFHIHASETAALRANGGQKTMARDSAKSKDAIGVLLKAPMLSDLNLWSHWELIFAPSLGPLLEWLLGEVNAEELLCLVTKVGKVIRIDQSATADSFLEAALQRSSFLTAVALLSLFSLAGGEKHVPLSLLKCYSRQAFGVLSKNHFEDMEVQDKRNYLLHGRTCKGAANTLMGELHKDFIKMNEMVSIASRFVLDCLGHLPSEFHGFAADVLLSGMQAVTKDAPSVILCECRPEERIMLHEIGLSIGIMDWIDDYHAFCQIQNKDLLIASRPSCLKPIVSGQDALDHFSFADARKEAYADINSVIDGSVVSNNGISYGCKEQLSDVKKHKDAALVIESIRRQEFGLDPSLSYMESSMLQKQHARLGRALHCLSQELYSQDSHFLLELVQNADDNIYPENVEPTLTFILQESGIVVLNNEQGFSAENIQALCDVGNSTKKGCGSGYIGQKGIGFKSVFRVTDAPEIHSNGFHIKFDIGEGQIGFVLPTAVPPCDVDTFSTLVSRHADQININCWNTCIVLPFRSKLSEVTAMEMFSDLHPSLLLFLHRLQCIMFRNMLNGSFIIMRREVLEGGIVKVSCGEDSMSWLVAIQKLEAHVSRPKVQKTEIAIAFTLESNDGNYIPRLDQQPVFAFLPLRTYGLKFILQGDFMLPSSREEVDKNNPWNEWLLTKYPGLFVSALRSFCALSCFRDNPGKAVSAYMSFVPLVGEVHGFFSGLPKAIISELRRTGCLLLEADNSKMVHPCNVLRGWNEQARKLLPDGLLQEYLGIGFLDKNIVLSDSLASALGIVEYGPEILIKFMTHLCHTENSLKLMGLGWLSSWLDSLYSMLSHSSGKSDDLMDDLRHIPFIPLSDDTYSAVDEGTIWLHSGDLSSGLDGAQGLKTFPKLYAKLRTVNPVLLSASAVDRTLVDNLTRMLHTIGVQQLSAHEIIKVHILPSISDDRMSNRDKNLMTDYVCFMMIHLQSSCHSCCDDRKWIVSELQNKAFILTNHGYKRAAETPIHFSKEFGNHVNVNKLINHVDVRWHEVDVSYLEHPVNESLSNGLMKWREFFQEIGVTDFVQVVQIDKSLTDLSHAVFKNMMSETDQISLGSVAKDWESYELVRLLSVLSTIGDGERCKYLLEVLDMLWDGSFSDKTTGYCYSKTNGDGKPFKSSFMSGICDVQWVVSSIDNKLHYPKDLFHDCDAIRSILGPCTPFAVPKVSSRKLLGDIGFKTEVTLTDALEILGVWSKPETPFKASIAQMSRLYTFIWDEMSASKSKISETFYSEPFIFVPYKLGSRHEDLVSGTFLSSAEVYWHDPTGSTDQIKIHGQFGASGVSQSPLSKTLCKFYPGLHDFFVNNCKVHETPSCSSYLDILLQLSTVALPSEAASFVFNVFLKWTDGLKSGSLNSEDISHLKECLKKLEYTILPTVQDKWVSLHPSVGLVCWCDDQKLGKKFKHQDNIDFLFFGSLSDEEQEMLRTRVSVLLHKLGIPALSEVITREAIYYGASDCSLKASLINWALPYAQRYIYSMHSDKYAQLKQSGFDNLNQLQVVVVEKLSYRNVIKDCVNAQKKYKCSCLLQGNTLFTTLESDAHTLFLELSRLFFDGSPELHLANFLHMITTMAESGSSVEQMEFFIVNSQKVTKLSDEESVWSLLSCPSPTMNDESFQIGVASTATNELNASKSKRKVGVSSNWPPVDWKTAPGFDYTHANGFNIQAAVSHSNGPDRVEDNSNDIVSQADGTVPFEIDTDWIIEEDAATVISPETKNVNHSTHACNQIPNMDGRFDPDDLHIVSGGPGPNSYRFCRRDQLSTGTANRQAMLTGRHGERVAFKYFTKQFGKKDVNWVNEDTETGLPYDIVIGEEGSSREYVEVKATVSARKDWFIISMREWQFAVEKGESFSIAHVALLGDNTAKVSIFRNPVKHCQLGNLQLVVMMPRQQQESSVTS